MLDARQTIEVFHLLFLRALGARVDKSLFSLKGGCNLRFFLRSIRYSEDMDLDIQTMAVGTLRNNVNRLLVEPTFVQGLRTHGIELLKIAEPKQTETTQRWKLILRNTVSRADTPTKIEFSRRGLDYERAIDPVDAAIIREYRLYPVIVQHYTASAAFTQKVLALALREQVQSRDVFDLKLLIDAGVLPIRCLRVPQHDLTPRSRMPWRSTMTPLPARSSLICNPNISSITVTKGSGLHYRTRS